jgi:hypothetical protein
VAAGLALVFATSVGTDETVGAPDRVAVVFDYGSGVFLFFIRATYLDDRAQNIDRRENHAGPIRALATADIF